MKKLLIILTILFLSLHAQSLEFVPPSDLKLGDVLKGRTRIDGHVMHEFSLKITSIQYSGREEYTIYALVEDDYLNDTGVAAGMSGSPVFFNGKLVGAVSSTFAFSRKPIAGITPIESMLKIFDYIGKEPLEISSFSSSPSSSVFNPLSVLGDLDSSSIKNLEKALEILPNKFIQESLTAEKLKNFSEQKPSSSATPENNINQTINLKPISLPLTISGSFPVNPQQLNQLKKSLGFANAVFAPGGGISAKHNVQNQAHSANKKFDKAAALNTKLVPGDYIGINFVRGDLNLSGFGTITYVSNDHILAFGHAMGSKGVVGLPLYKAKVDTFIPLQTLSFKMANLEEEIGSLVQDRQSGVLGVIGEPASYIPVTFDLKSPIQNNTYNFEVAYNQDGFGRIIDFLILQTFFYYESIGNPGTINYRLQVDIDIPDAEPKTIVISNQLSGYNILLSSWGSMLIMDQIDYLMRHNSFSKARISNVHLSMNSTPVIHQETIQSVKKEKDIYQPGETVHLKVEFNRFREPKRIEDFSFTLPKDLPEGKHFLVISPEWLRWIFDYSFIFQKRGIRSIDDLVDILKSRPRDNYLNIWMIKEDPSLIIQEEVYHRLPVNQKSLLWNSLQSKKDFYNQVIYKEFKQLGSISITDFIPLMITVKKKFRK